MNWTDKFADLSALGAWSLQRADFENGVHDVVVKALMATGFVGAISYGTSPWQLSRPCRRDGHTSIIAFGTTTFFEELG
ncbi:hypothetical protein NKI95_25030 [Mesorhizobium sp. M0306]|uniref:hypothetical protein n=1 Tax=Mesorhizobium sp. M0306 TaxID=2956932 RepID=UPI0033396BA2